MIDREGFRSGVAIILLNDKNCPFWARRIGGQNAWQFPQGGVDEGESFEEAMYRELHEEAGLLPESVEILGETQKLLRYRLPRHLVRRHTSPVCIGQKQKWYLLRLVGSEEKINFSATDKPEFDGFRWVSYWFPLREVIGFKRRVYKKALQEFSKIVFKEKDEC